MTGQAIERAHPAAMPAPLTDREIRSIEFQARAIVALDKRVAGDKEKGLALAVTLYSLGVPVTVTNAKKLHIIGDEVVESSQLLLGLLSMHGFEVRVVEESDERATVSGRRHTGDEPHSVTYTIEQARRSGALDEWVEKWETSQGGKKYPVRHYLVFEGEPNQAPPEPWAKTAVERGQVKRMDAWHKYRSDMLVNRAIRRLAKRMGGAALLGVGVIEDAREGAIEAEVIEDDGAEVAVAPPGPVSDGPDPAAALRNERGRIADAAGRIPEGQWRAAWAKAWRAAELPDMRSLTEEHLETACTLVRQYLALASLDAIGVKAAKDRHAFVSAATDGATESTKALTAEQLSAVLAAVRSQAEEQVATDTEPEYGPDGEPF